MKPISVRFQCFGPYVKEQYVDFRQLGKNGLFLICGETGSGKTTILDAICYALYGKSSGGLRGDMSVMRCKHADPADETFVEYIFSSGENTYRFYRCMKPRKKRKGSQSQSTDMNEFYECQILVDGEFVPVPDAKDKKTFLNEKAQQIIGLTYDQFRQVIILPQGQFEKLLVSDSEEKEKILVTLFHAERWQKIALKMFEIAEDKRKNLADEKLRIEEKLGVYECTDVQQLMDTSSAQKEQVNKLQKQLEEASEQVEVYKKQQETASREMEAFLQLDQLQKKVEELSLKEDFYNQEKSLLNRADLADRITPSYQDYQLALNTKLWKEGEVDAARNQLEASQIRLIKINEEKENHEKQRPDYECQKEKIVLLQNAEALYQSLEKLKSQNEQAGKERITAEREAKAAETDFADANEAWENAVLSQQNAIKAHQDAQLLYLQGIGSVLAEKLQEGEKCPVCGSLHHPEPAKPIEGHVTESEIDKLGKAMGKANRLETSARKARSQAQEKNEIAQKLLAEKKQAAALSQSTYEQAMSRLISGIETEAMRIRMLNALLASVSAFENEDAQMQEKINTAVSVQKTAENTLEQALITLKSAETILCDSQKNWNKELSEAGFTQQDQYLSAVIPVDEKLSRRENVIHYSVDLKNAREAVLNQQRELNGKERPDVTAADKKLKDAETLRNEVNNQFILKQDFQKDMERDAKALTVRMEKYHTEKLKNEEDMVFAKRLRGDYGISLQRYVLGVMLTSITHAANELLKTVYGGRYQLYRTNETSGSARKRGLELEVADQDGRRSVTTLSGGEKFLLSLSLAIGLSTVVQAQGSGVRLEAMFIDEGFGSLDRKSIDDAIEVLQQVRRSSGIVGIISHVDRLSETIPTKIKITKTKEGSMCSICC